MCLRKLNERLAIRNRLKSLVPKKVISLYYSDKIESLRFPASLKEMILAYYGGSSVNLVSKMWLYLQFYHFKTMAIGEADNEVLKVALDRFSKNYTLRYQNIHQLSKYGFPHNDLKVISSDADVRQKLFDFFASQIRSKKILQAVLEQRGAGRDMDLVQAGCELDRVFQERGEPAVIIEIGSGYGRIGELISKAFPHIKYIVVDIPPALWVAQTYLGSAGVDRLRNFDSNLNASTLKNYLKYFQYLFLMPSQITLLPRLENSVVMAINCFQEIEKPVIDFYFSSFSRVADDFYIKAQKSPNNVFGDDFLTEERYENPFWEDFYHDTCSFPNTYFERMMRVVTNK
jgi:putative sugar O-methyltransferase